MKRITVGILAHVDAGKTTLSEALLYRGGRLKKPGRVDHGDAFLDTDALERCRGITIFAKQAVLPLPDAVLTLLDTPGHVDFAAEAERTLSVLDCAVLVISGTEGVQSHTSTLWHLLRTHRVPTFVFVNKMDLLGADRAAVLEQLNTRLEAGFVDFSLPADELAEEIAGLDETALEDRKEEIRSILARLPLSGLSVEYFSGDRLTTGLNDGFYAPQWQELYQSCIGCGTCTFICPTCQCYDIRDFDTGHGIKRFRCWDSCMYSDFTKMAHGNPRTSQLERFRQRFMHKLVYYPANNDGLYSCVGCGRCVSKCPASLNIVKVIKKLGGEA